MAKKKDYRAHKSKGFTLPLAVVSGIIAMPTVSSVIEAAMIGDFASIPTHIKGFMADSNNVFKPDWLINNLKPLVVGILVHKYIGGTLGVNRMLASANVPVIRL